MLSSRVIFILALFHVAPVACAREAAETRSELDLFDADDVRELARDTNRPVLVSLWATWCAPCLGEIPVLSAFQEAHPEAVVLGLSTDDLGIPGRAARLAQILAERRPTYRQGRLQSGSEDAFLRSFGRVWDGTLPKLVLVGPDGEPRLVLDQAVDKAMLSRLVAPRLNEPGRPPDTQRQP